MIATDTAVSTVGFYINGAWEQPAGRAQGTVTNPATGAVLAGVPYANDADVDAPARLKCVDVLALVMLDSCLGG